MDNKDKICKIMIFERYLIKKTVRKCLLKGKIVLNSKNIIKIPVSFEIEQSQFQCTLKIKITHKMYPLIIM